MLIITSMSFIMTSRSSVDLDLISLSKASLNCWLASSADGLAGDELIVCVLSFRFWRRSSAKLSLALGASSRVGRATEAAM